jgi:RNA polymerase sigma-70 factor, ECF subfamily
MSSLSGGGLHKDSDSFVAPKEPDMQSATSDSQSDSSAQRSGSVSQMDEFLGLFNGHRRQILVYLASLLPSQSDVDDVFQETSMVLWREFHEFKPGTNFAAWACSIAFNRVRAWRSRRNREQLIFSDTMLQLISDQLLSHSDYYQERLQALDGCIASLRSHHRDLLNSRYQAGMSIEAIAETSQRTPTAVYRMLSRIRQALHECVERKTKSTQSAE